MYVKVRFNGVSHMVTDLSRLAKVELLRKKVAEKTGVAPDRQRLFFKGKQLENKYTLFDYDVTINAVIELAEKVIFDDSKKGEKEKSGKVEDEADETNKENIDNVGEEIDPDAREEERLAALAGASKEPVGETAKEPAEGEEIKLEDIYHGDPNDLKEPECKKCKDDKTKQCGECGCVICKGKENPAECLLCDECEYAYHIYCLDPPLEKIPDDDWYCPDCKNETEEIVNPGAMLKMRKSKAKMPSQVGKSNRDWGNGMATAGRSKSCTKVPSNHFGPIPGVEVGMTWKYRIQISEEGLHRPPVAGIAGKPTEGAYSIVLAGGYEDDVDNGDEFFYTGAGGRDLSGNKRTSEQAFDQELTKTNLAIAVSCHAKVNATEGADAGDKWRKGKAIRVIRSEKLKKHSQLAPDEGCRYDGIYKVVKYWLERGRSGFMVWRYLFRRDDDSPAPWTEQGKKICQKNGYTCVYPDGYLESQAEKLKNKKAKDAKNSSGDGEEEKEEVEEAKAPPAKKAKTVYEVDEDVRELISSEEKNKKTWDLILESPMTTKLDFTNIVEEHFVCPMCQYLLYKPVTTRCGHNFCLECFNNILKKSETKACPNCRKTLEEEDKEDNETLSEILLKVFPGYGIDR